MSYAPQFAPDAREALKQLPIWLQERTLDEIDRLADHPGELTQRGLLPGLVHDFVEEREGVVHYVFLVFDRDDAVRSASRTADLHTPTESATMRCMTREELLDRIWIDPKRCFGKPCIRGHRIWVSLILDFLASGMTVEQILEQYPQLEVADILACVAYGSEMSRERYVEIPLESGA